MIPPSDLSAYVGRQWRLDWTCWSGIVVPVYREFLGVDLPAYDTIPPTDPKAVIPAVRRFFRGWQTIEDGRERPMDVVLFDHGTHCGLVLDRGRMLHLEQGKTSVVTSYRSPLWASRIVNFHRLAP
jgi:cell wall-associated NlpC family hydrolase